MNQCDGLGQWLKERCQKEGLSLRQAATKTGLSHATIADLMNGAQPSAETVRKLAGAFGGDGHTRMALEDKLLSLGGYRSERPEEELTEPLARLLDRLSLFNEAQLKIVGRFCDFLGEMEKK